MDDDAVAVGVADDVVAVFTELLLAAVDAGVEIRLFMACHSQLRAVFVPKVLDSPDPGQLLQILTPFIFCDPSQNACMWYSRAPFLTESMDVVISVGPSTSDGGEIWSTSLFKLLTSLLNWSSDSIAWLPSDMFSSAASSVSLSFEVASEKIASLAILPSSLTLQERKAVHNGQGRFFETHDV